MAEITGTINGGIPPYSIVIRKVGETTGNRCTSGCNGFPTTFDEDAGNNSYYFTVTDSSPEPCLIDSRIIEGGVSNVNCDVVQPSFTAQLVQPVCVDGIRSNSVLKLTNIVGAYRYKICYNTLSMNCASCSDSDGFISGSTLDIILDNPPETTGNRGVLIRVYADSSCTNFKEFFTTIVNPVCEGGDLPDFSAAVIQPYCSSATGGNVVNATLKLTDISNAVRYKICYNSSTFSGACNTSCSTSDGLISGSSIDIEITSPTEGNSQTNTIRVFETNACNSYKDYTFSISSPKCSTNQLNLAVMDLFFNKGSNSCGTNPIPRSVDFDMYVTPNTSGVTENGQKSLSRATFERNVPNGNDVPNVFLAASLEMNCNTGTGFYRWFFNLALMRAKYPSINVFTFDVYIDRILGAGNPSIQARITAQANVAMIKVNTPQTTNCDGSAAPTTLVNNTDVGRVPCYAGNAVDHLPLMFYGVTNVGYKKMGTISFNISANTYTWTTL